MNAQKRRPRLLRRQLTRRELLGAVTRAGLGATGLVLVGCGGDDGETAPARRPAETEQRSPAALTQQDRQQEPAVLGGHSRLGAQAQAEQAATQETAGATTDAGAIFDPVEWRERYHWSKLKDAPGSGDGPVRGGTLYLNAPHPRNWNPLASARTGEGHLLPLVYSQLLTLAADDHTDVHRNVIEGQLAETWEMPDPASVVFGIRGDVAWRDQPPTDGRELTADDVKIACDALRTSEATPARAWDAITRIDADAQRRTVSMQLSGPFGYWPVKLTSPWQVILPPEVLDRPDLLSPEPMTGAASWGTGPFHLVPSIQGFQWRLQRNNDYFKRDDSGAPLPYLNAVVAYDYVLVSLASTQGSSGARDPWWDWEHDDLDAIYPAGSEELGQGAVDAPSSVVQVTPPTPGGAPYFTYRSMTAPPFNDARVRLALSTGLDRAAMATSLYSGLAAPDCGQNWTLEVDGNTASGLREWPWTLAELGSAYGYDPAAARALLQAAGYDANNPLAIRIDAPVQAPEFAGYFHWQAGPVEATAEQLRTSLGDAAQVELTHRVARFFDDGRIEIEPQDDADLIAQPSVGGYAPDPDDLVYHGMHAGGALNTAQIADADVDQWSADLRATADTARRSALLEQIRRRESEQAWRLFLVNPYGVQLRKPSVHNLVCTYAAKGVPENPAHLERVWKVSTI